MQKTRLEQFGIASVDNCLQEFVKRTKPNVIPIVLTPSARTPCSCYMTIPTGPLCIMHKWGRDEGYNKENHDDDYLAEPGLICTPAFKRVAYCVTSQAITYNAPVKSCPTADNVMVDCDLTLVFGIGPAPHQVKQFVYKLGARRFDEMLEAAVEEAIRHLIRNCPHTDIYELRGGNSDKVRRTLDELNKKFQPFGVNFNSAAITEVRFSQSLQASLQNTTNYTSKMKEEEKRQKNELDKIQFMENRELTDLERQHARIIQDLQAQRTRVEINRTEEKTLADQKLRVAVTKERESAKVNETKAESEQKVAKTKGLSLKETQVSRVRAKDKAQRIKVEAECSAKEFKAQQSLEATQNICAALLEEAKMEEKAVSMLKAKREYDLRMAKLEALSHIARNNKIVISGEIGDALIKEMVTEDIMGEIKVK